MTATALEPAAMERPSTVRDVTRRRAATWMGVVALGVGLALFPTSVASAAQYSTTMRHGATAHEMSSHKKHKKKHKKAKAKTPVASSSAKSVCSFLDNEAGSAKIASAVESAEQSGNFASAKQTLLDLFDQIAKDAPSAEADLRSAPANVQAAFKTMISYDAQFQTALENATSFSQLGSAFASLGNNPTLQAASSTVGSYATSLCGS